MRFNNKIVEAIAINEIRGTFQTRLNIGWSRRCPHILIKCTRLSRKEERKRDSVDFTHCVCVRPTLLQFLAPRSSFPSLSLPRRRVIAHPRAIASLLPCGIGERIPRLWSVPPPGIYIYLLSGAVLWRHFRYLGRTSAFVICGEITAGIKAETKTISPDGRRNLIRSDTPHAFPYTDFRSTPEVTFRASIVTAHSPE